MVFANHFASIASELLETQDGGELQQRLKLYQVFLKLYQHHRGLLDEILDLENSSSKSLSSVTLPYIQGVTLGQETYLVTNLLHGKTQAVLQPQQTWMIGREPRHAAIAIQDTRLSRCHAALRYVEHQGFYLIDLNSRNGSYVNGELMRQSRLLQDGDRVRLGSVTFVFFHCQSLQHVQSLPTEMQNFLENWQPTSGSPNLTPQPDGDELPTAAGTSTTAPLDETSMFMRANAVVDKFMVQAWDF